MSAPNHSKLAAALALAALLGTTAAARADDDPPQAHSDGVAATLSDTAVTAKVKARLAGDERLQHADITVHTNNGVVTLSGNAPSAEAADAAETIAQGVGGVKSVENEIDAPSKLTEAAQDTGRKVSDAWITTKVKAQLKANRSVQGDSDISVKTSHGVVMLSGTAASKDALQNATAVARSVKGVTSVDTSNLRLASSD